MTFSTEPTYHDLIIIINKVKTTIPGYESSDLLSVLPEEHSHGLTDTGVRLLGTDTDLLSDETLGLGGSSEGVVPSLLEKSLFQSQGPPP